MLITSSIVLCLALCGVMLIGFETGFRVGRWRRGEGGDREEMAAVDAAIFALLGLLLGFAFAGAMSRLDTRRDLIVKETNAIGTAYLRVDLLPLADQPEMRRLFRGYLDERLHVFDSLDRGHDAEPAMAAVARLQREIWTKSVEASRKEATGTVERLVLPALNEMIDVTTTRTVALHTRLPTLILGLLLGVAVLSSLLAGHAMAKRGRRNYLHAAIYAATVSLTIYAVLDLDDPRRGLIRLEAADQILRQLHQSM